MLRILSALLNGLLCAVLGAIVGLVSGALIGMMAWGKSGMRTGEWHFVMIAFFIGFGGLGAAFGGVAGVWRGLSVPGEAGEIDEEFAVEGGEAWADHGDIL